MTCRDFEQRWNDRLDARGVDPLDPERALEAHAAACPSCRSVHARYRALSRALLALAPPPPPPAGLADRVLAARAAERAEARPRAWEMGRRWVPLAAAAAVFAAVALGLRGRPPARVAPGPPTAAEVRAIDPGDLTEALTDATRATWELAREASAPAARVGRQVFSRSEVADNVDGPRLALPVGVAPAAEVLQGVGDRVNAGVRPLEGSARHAFSFLLGPSPEGPRPAL